MNILISIIVPVYNVKAYIKKCLDSLVYQTYPNIEIILVNDGSTDESGEICDEYREKYSNIIVYHMENGGVSKARNIGIGISKGEYLMFVDSDDTIELDSCEIFVEYMKANNPDMIVADAVKVKDGKASHISHNFEEGIVSTGSQFFSKQLQAGSFNVMVWLYIYRRNFLIQNKFLFREDSGHEDELYSPQTLLKADTIVYTGVVFYNYHIRKGSLSDIKSNDSSPMDFIRILYDLDKIYCKVQDEYFRKLLLEDILVKYLHIYQVYKYENDCLSDEYFVRGKAIGLRNRIKAYIFLRNKKIYYILNSIIKCVARVFK